MTQKKLIENYIYSFSFNFSFRNEEQTSNYVTHKVQS